MSGIYIPGMDMPNNCHECVAGYGGCCYVAPADADGICPDHGRADFCPLVPVPDHGRLADLDAFVRHLRRDPLFPLVERYGLSGVIENWPAVIPADGEVET